MRPTGPEPHRAGDPAGRLFGGALQGVIVEMCIDRSGFPPSVTKQPADRGETHTIHDALGRPSVSQVVDTQARQPRLLADDAPELAETRRRKVVGE